MRQFNADRFWVSHWERSGSKLWGLGIHRIGLAPYSPNCGYGHIKHYYILLEEYYGND